MREGKTRGGGRKGGIHLPTPDPPCPSVPELVPVCSALLWETFSSGNSRCRVLTPLTLANARAFVAETEQTCVCRCQVRKCNK